MWSGQVSESGVIAFLLQITVFTDEAVAAAQTICPPLIISILFGGEGTPAPSSPSPSPPVPPPFPLRLLLLRLLLLCRLLLLRAALLSRSAAAPQPLRSRSAAAPQRSSTNIVYKHSLLRCQTNKEQQIKCGSDGKQTAVTLRMR